MNQIVTFSFIKYITHFSASTYTIYICVCMYIYVYTYMCVYMYICVCVYTHTHILRERKNMCGWIHSIRGRSVWFKRAATGIKGCRAPTLSQALSTQQVLNTHSYWWETIIANSYLKINTQCQNEIRKIQQSNKEELRLKFKS